MSSQALKGYLVYLKKKQKPLYSDTTGCNDYTLNELKTLRGDYAMENSTVL